jgi:hypothetical protein
MWSSVFASQQYSMPMSPLGQTRSCGPCRLNVRFARKRTRLTPLADLGRSAGQAPLHGLHAAGVAAAHDDAKIGARPLQRRRIPQRSYHRPLVSGFRNRSVRPRLIIFSQCVMRRDSLGRRTDRNRLTHRCAEAQCPQADIRRECLDRTHSGFVWEILW